MADIDIKALTPGAAAASSVIVGAANTAAASPSLFTTSGSGSVVLTTSPTLVTPNLGTPSALTLTNATGLPIAGVTGWGTGVATALAIAIGSAGAPVLFNGAGGTPSSLTLTNASGLPVGGIAAIASNTFVANGTGGSASPTALSAASATALLSVMVGDSGSGGVKGLAPAPAAGDAAAGKFLKADGTYAVPPGGSGGSPGGASLTVQYNNAGAFGGMSGTAWDDTNRALTITGATVTTSNPILNLTQTWNAGAVTFTGLKFNVTDTASAAASLLLDLQIGGTSYFRVQKNGSFYWNIPAQSTTYGLENGAFNSILTIRGVQLLGFNVSGGGVGVGLTLKADSAYAWGSTLTSVGDLLLTRAAAATLQLGAADAAGSPVAQTIRVQSASGVADTAGANFTIQGSAGTGTGAGGSIIFQVAPASTTASTKNAYATALTLASDKSATFTGNVTAPQTYNPTQTLTDGATISWDANVSAVATVTLGGTGRTLTPSNLKNGGTYLLFVKQDATGSRTITTWTNFRWPGGAAPTLSTAANAVDIITGVSDGTYIYATFQTGFA